MKVDGGCGGDTGYVWGSVAWLLWWGGDENVDGN